MKTITLQGTEEQINNLQLNAYKFKTVDLPVLVEIRVYVVNIDNYEFDTSPINWNDAKFMSEAEIQGTVFTLQGFELAFNLENISSFTDVIRIISVPLSF